MSKYTRGRAFEWRVRDDLRSRGYFVLRSAGSKSPVDLVALPEGGGDVLLVQCKLDGVITAKEWNTLFELGTRLVCTPVLAQRGATYSVLAGKRERRSAPLKPLFPVED